MQKIKHKTFDLDLPPPPSLHTHKHIHSQLFGWTLICGRNPLCLILKSFSQFVPLIYLTEIYFCHSKAQKRNIDKTI